MAVAGTDMKLLLSGDSGNSSPSFSLGGGRSSTEVVFSPILDNLFDDVTAVEAAAGVVEYRCVYIQNDHATDNVDSVKIWMNTDTPSASTAIAIGLDPAGKNATAFGPISPSSVAPTGVVFTAPTTEGAGLSVGRLNAQEVYAFWIRRTVTAAAPSANNDAFSIAFSGTPL